MGKHVEKLNLNREKSLDSDARLEYSSWRGKRGALAQIWTGKKTTPAILKIFNDGETPPFECRSGSGKNGCNHP